MKADNRRVPREAHTVVWSDARCLHSSSDSCMLALYNTMVFISLVTHIKMPSCMVNNPRLCFPACCNSPNVPCPSLSQGADLRVQCWYTTSKGILVRLVKAHRCKYPPKCRHIPTSHYHHDIAMICCRYTIYKYLHAWLLQERLPGWCAWENDQKLVKVEQSE